MCSSISILDPTSLRQLACTRLTPASTILSANHTGDTKERFTTNDIDAGEEITFCYDPYDAHMTRSERHESLQHMGFACKCRACQLEAPFQQLSGLRRRLIRGVRYLANGKD
ncbi:hypothetical protein N7467_005869 [Penicillium canescens]|nr:hypothetical protein N7467_005869 [Penicillium canescens]